MTYIFDCEVFAHDWLFVFKNVEAHLGMDIRESEVDFNIDHPLTPTELEETVFYCKHDVDATEQLYHLRKGYLENKLTLGRAKGIEDNKALYMTNAKLTAAYLDQELLYANKMACSPPLPTSEIQTIVNSVTKYRR